MNRPMVETDPSTFPGFGLRLVAGLLIWALHLSVIYAATGLICARPGLRFELANISLLNWLVGGATAAAVLALAAVMLAAGRRLAARTGGAEGRFFQWIVLAVAGLSPGRRPLAGAPCPHRPAVRMSGAFRLSIAASQAAPSAAAAPA